ncbi:MAG: MOSC domain-containing protein [Sphingobacteriaceae bacterium]|nr:MOSC domain-containing protein [Cytophagaceae bacterium]
MTEPDFTDSPMRELMRHDAQAGRVEWIGLRPGRRQPVESVPETYARPGTGLDGDRYWGTPDSKRQVTLIQAEHLAAVASFLGKETLDPALLRRNLVVRGINLHSLKSRPFRVGEAVLELTGDCHPCSRMEETLGEGGYNALRGHGGITARVLQEGAIQVGDAVAVV